MSSPVLLFILLEAIKTINTVVTSGETHGLLMLCILQMLVITILILKIKISNVES